MNKLIRSGTLCLLFSGMAFSFVQAQEEEDGPSKKEVAVAEKRFATEIETLASKPEVKKALDLFKERNVWTLKNLIYLTEIPAPPFKEDKRGLAYAEMLRAAGADSVWIDEVGNVLALRKGKKGNKTVVLEAHLDTVFPEGTDVKVKYRGDSLFAPGVGDDTRGLAMVLPY